MKMLGFCPHHKGFRDDSGEEKPLPFIYHRKGYAFCSKCIDEVFDQFVKKIKMKSEEEVRNQLEAILNSKDVGYEYRRAYAAAVS